MLSQFGSGLAPANRPWSDEVIVKCWRAFDFVSGWSVIMKETTIPVEFRVLFSLGQLITRLKVYRNIDLESRELIMGE